MTATSESDKICIVIPCYNVEKRFPATEFDEFFRKHENLCFCFVNDASIDTTSSILQELRIGREERILIVELDKNSGKGEAVRNGVLKAAEWKNFGYYAYFDADLATPLGEVFNLLDSIQQKSEYMFALGSRIKMLGKNIVRNPYRHYFGRVTATLASNALRLPVYDTQCGAKLLKAGLIEKVFQEPFHSRWLFDIEILFRIIKLYGKNEAKEKLVETALNQWIEKGDSTIKAGDVLKAPFELFKIKKIYSGQYKGKIVAYKGVDYDIGD